MKKNIEAHLKIWLLEGKTITHNQAQKLWGTNRLSEFIRRLRRKGMDIDMKMKSGRQDRHAAIHGASLGGLGFRKGGPRIKEPSKFASLV